MSCYVLPTHSTVTRLWRFSRPGNPSRLQLQGEFWRGVGAMLVLSWREDPVFEYCRNPEVEWLDDSSCNLVFEAEDSVQKAA